MTDQMVSKGEHDYNMARMWCAEDEAWQSRKLSANYHFMNIVVTLETLDTAKQEHWRCLDGCAQLLYCKRAARHSYTSPLGRL
jgi:hypothetical protein